MARLVVSKHPFLDNEHLSQMAVPLGTYSIYIAAGDGPDNMIEYPLEEHEAQDAMHVGRKATDQLANTVLGSRDRWLFQHC